MVVELRHVTKIFPGVRALDGVNLRIASASVLGLVGENGAGKSTLMKILSGVYPSSTYEGEIFIDGKKTTINTPAEAEALGIAIIHQELSAFSHLSVAENLFVGRWPTRHGLVQWSEIEQQAEQWIRAVGAKCSPSDLMGDLSVGTQQLIEIAKALAKNSRVLILDEPTSSLTPNETKTLFALLKELRLNGKALVYISHKMEEIFELCDSISVLRDGRAVHDCEAQSTNTEDLVRHMVGRQVEKIYPPSPKRELSQNVLELRNFSAYIPQKKFKLGPIDLQLKAGEILGLGGLLGSGRTELAKALFGDLAMQKLSGEIRVANQIVDISSPARALALGISFVSEDRKAESILPERSLTENEAISKLAVFYKKLKVDDREEALAARSRLESLNTKFSSLDQKIRELSGGNQQKVIIARAIETNAKIIILDEPTRGIDIKAKSEIYEIIFKLACSGHAILLISSDLPELIALSDRIAMMKDGQIKGILERGKFSPVDLMRLSFETQPHVGTLHS